MNQEMLMKRIFTCRFTYLFTVASCTFLLLSCQDKKDGNQTTTTPTVDITTTGMNFEMPAELPSGWSTFNYNNQSKEEHFFILEKLPDSIRLTHYKNELLPPFKEMYSAILSGRFDEAQKAMGKFPAWLYKMQNSGGVGLLSGGQSGTTTINLQPGYYAVECYVRMPNGLPHVFMGMLNELHVTDSNNKAPAPVADLDVHIDTLSGIQFIDTVKKGKHLIAVHFDQQKMYEHFCGHDVNIVKLDPEGNLDSLNKWINAADFSALRTPAPTGLRFLGGANDMPSGTTAYIQITLEPGNYLLISEIPQARERRMMHRFVVL